MTTPSRRTDEPWCPVCGEQPDDRIKAFVGDFEFLSNFYITPVTFEGVTYPSAEHAFQAAKTKDKVKRYYFSKHIETPGQAKRAGRKLRLRQDWEEVKIDIMEQIIRDKFSRDPLKSKLYVTGTLELIEGNYWGDQFWGVCEKKGWGRNMLGKTLMKVREGLKNEE